MFSVSTLDPDLDLKATLIEIYPEASKWPYRAAEDLAEQGLGILKDHMVGDDIWFTDLLNKITEANRVEPNPAEAVERSS